MLNFLNFRQKTTYGSLHATAQCFRLGEGTASLRLLTKLCLQGQTPYLCLIYAKSFCTGAFHIQGKGIMKPSDKAITDCDLES